MTTTPNGSTPGPFPLAVPAHNDAAVKDVPVVTRGESHDTACTVVEPSGPSGDLEAQNEDRTASVASNDGEHEKHNDKPVVTYPEGGLEAWLVTLGAWAAMVVGLVRLHHSHIYHPIKKILPQRKHVDKEQSLTRSSPGPRKHHRPHSGVRRDASAIGLLGEHNLVDLQPLRLPRLLLRPADRAHLRCARAEAARVRGEHPVRGLHDDAWIMYRYV